MNDIFLPILRKLYGKWSVALVLLFSGLGYWFFWSSSDYFCIPVKIDDYWGCPILQMEIGKKTYQVQLNLGFDLSSLNRRDLRELEKRYCGIYSAIDALGNKHDRSSYEVLGAKLKGFKVPKIEIHEELPEVIASGDPEKISSCGHLGRGAFNGENYLLDFASSRIIICKNFKDLVKLGFDLKSFVEVPFKVNTAGICFRVETDIGEKTLFLDTNSQCCLRFPREKETLSIDNSRSLPAWSSQKFALNGHEFGPRKFVLFEISPLLDMIDGSLGMDFLKQHAIYIDSEKSIAYIQKSSAPSLPKA